MTAPVRHRLRRWLLAACLAASVPLVVRAGGVAAELRRDRLAADTYQRGVVAQMAGRLDEAAEAYQATLAISPRAVEAYGSLAEVEFKRGRVDDAVRAYRQLLAIYPYTYVASLYREVGVMELRARRPQDARGDLAQAVALDPGDWLAHYFLGHAYKQLGETSSARAAWRRVTMLHPEYRPAYE